MSDAFKITSKMISCVEGILIPQLKDKLRVHATTSMSNDSSGAMMNSHVCTRAHAQILTRIRIHKRPKITHTRTKFILLLLMKTAHSWLDSSDRWRFPFLANGARRLWAVFYARCYRFVSGESLLFLFLSFVMYSFIDFTSLTIALLLRYDNE